MALPTYLYHYTTKDAAEQIKQDKLIRKSVNRSRDAVLGEGVYLTDLPPSSDDRVLLENNYGHVTPSRENNVQVCFRFNTSDLIGYRRKRFGSRLIYMYPDDINLDNVNYHFMERGENGKWNMEWKSVAVAVGGAVIGGLLVAGLAMLVKNVLDSDKEKKEDSENQQKYKY